MFRVDFHTWALLKGVVLSTLLGVGAELQFSGESDLVQALRQSTQQSVSRAGDQPAQRLIGLHHDLQQNLWAVGTDERTHPAHACLFPGGGCAFQKERGGLGDG
jgi:hypothetical protein